MSLLTAIFIILSTYYYYYYRYLDQPLSNFLESYSNTDGKRCCWFVDSTSDSTPYCVSANLRRTQANSQLPDGSDIPPVALVDAVTHSQPLVSDFSSSNNQSPSQFSKSDTQPSTDLVPSQSLDPVDLPSSVQPPLLDHTTSDFHLSTFQPVTEPTFVWGTMDSANFIHSLDAAYSDVTHWIKNCFVVPRCSAGRAFVSELARLFCSVGEGSALESITLKAVIVICALLLQKPTRNYKERDHIRHLERCLTLWKEGALDELLCEGHVIQSRLKHAPSARKGAQITRSFTKLMFEGNTRAALQLLTGHDQGGVLNLNDPADPSNLNFLFMMLSELSTLLLSHFCGSVSRQQWIILQSTRLCLTHWMLQWCVLPLFVQWVLLDHLGLMLAVGGDCAPPFVQPLMNFAVQLLHLPDDCVLHTFLRIFSLHFCHVGSLLWTSPQEFDPLEFVRWCDVLWQRQLSTLFKMTFRLLRDPINSVRAKLLGQRLQSMPQDQFLIMMIVMLFYWWMPQMLLTL